MPQSASTALVPAIAYKFYVFPSSWIGGLLYNSYLPFAAVSAVMCTISACSSRFGDREKLKKILRLVSFAVPYLFDSIPLAARLYLCYSEDCPDESFRPHLRQFLIAPMVAFLFATHFPECIAPGKFDVVGHSHQLFHVLVALATNDQLNALIWDMVHRREYLNEHGTKPTFFWSLGVGLFVFTANMLIVYAFSVLIKHQYFFRKYTGNMFYKMKGRAKVNGVANGTDKKSS
ncbi:membrane progestin receptor gamma-A-like [Ptychodera flava]|uniref:membrane progestin receptor gamma-A-like n=1 Tax=Ptychodera flava TaxID=63121 RepID=UPI00396A15C0